MPSARTHDLITFVTAAAGTPLALNSGLPDMDATNVVVLAGAYLASGLLFSPDLDLRSTPYRRWHALRFIWIPYQKMVPHRSWVSHSLVFGPFIRVFYFAFMMSLLSLIVLGVVRLLVPVDPTGVLFSVSSDIARWVEAHPMTVLYSATGFVLGAAAHTIADSVTTAFKRRF